MSRAKNLAAIPTIKNSSRLVMATLTEQVIMVCACGGGCFVWFCF